MEEVDAVVHFAAESHVDRSIADPGAFVSTNVQGTFTLLEAARRAGVDRFVHVSTDEVYGSIASGAFRETDPLRPSSPYSASKAGSDLLALAYHTTHDLPVIVTRCSNNYGPYQFPEKLIPLFVTNLLEGKKVPIYGSGTNVREWIYVLDHCRAVDFVLGRGTPGEVYNIGSGVEKTNLEITDALLALLGKDASSVEHVGDRKGHDFRYAIDCSKLRVPRVGARVHVRGGPRRDRRLVPDARGMVAAPEGPVLILGATGRLGRALARVYPDAVLVGHELEITDARGRLVRDRRAPARARLQLRRVHRRRRLRGRPRPRHWP